MLTAVADRRLRRLSAVSLSAIVVLPLLVFRVQLLQIAGWTLVADDPIGSADVIVVPQWAGDAGALEAADLIHQGVAPRVAVLASPRGPATKELVRRGLLNQPPPQNLWVGNQ